TLAGNHSIGALMAQVTPPTDGAAPKKPRTTKPATAGSTTPAKAPAAKTTAAKTPAAKTSAAKSPAAKTPAAKAPAAKTTAAKAPAAKTPAAKAPATAQAPAAAPAESAPAATITTPATTTPTIPVPPAPVDAATPAIPAPPADGSAPVYAPPAPTRRRVWPWVLGGGIVLLILLIVGVSALVGTVLGVVSGASQPSATVIAFDKSYKDADCKLFKSTTTEAFRNTFFDNGFSCDQWVDVANGLHDDGVYNYTVDVHATKVNGNTADVTTTEKDTTPGSEEKYELDYTLVKSNGSWVIDGITNIG
ncbi:MAG: hypothetical protein ABI632_11615, partial [Pseudolysinimonas sp.]